MTSVLGLLLTQNLEPSSPEPHRVSIPPMLSCGGEEDRSSQSQGILGYSGRARSILRPSLRPPPLIPALPSPTFRPLGLILPSQRVLLSSAEPAAPGGTLGEEGRGRSLTQWPLCPLCPEWPLSHMGEVPLQVLRWIRPEQGLFSRGSHSLPPCTALWGPMSC